jgi:hypothetical protein
MAPHSAPGGPSAAGADDLDALFNDFSVPLSDPFATDLPTYVPPSASPSKKRTSAALGIDAEVELTRNPRGPRPKLDEER